MKRAALFIVLIACAMVFGCKASEGSLNPPAQDFSLQDLNNRTVRLSDYSGKVIILNFFATWCPPCKAEIPYFIELLDEYGDKGLAVIGVSLDEGGQSKVRDFVKDMGINYPVLMNDGLVDKQFGPIRSIPATFIIDKKGNIISQIVGSRPKAVFETAVKPLLAQ